MSAADPLLVETLTRMLEEHCAPEVVERAERGEWPKALWDTLEAAGLPLAWVPETHGGAGAGLADGFGIVRIAARYAAPVPLAETLLAGWTLSQAGVDAPPGPLSAAPTRSDGVPLLDSRDRLSGVLRGVPFASHARALVLVARRDDGAVMAMLELDAERHRDRIGRGSSLAGEPRDDVFLDDLIPNIVVDLPADFDLAQCRMGAALRAQQIAGALEAALEQSLRYAGDRKPVRSPHRQVPGSAAQPRDARGRGGGGRRGGGCRGLGHRALRRCRRTAPFARWRQPRFARERRRAAARRSPTRFTARSGSPVSTACSTALAACGPGGTTSDPKPSGRTSSAAGWRRRGRTGSGRT